MSIKFNPDATKGIAFDSHADAKPTTKKAPLPPFSPKGQSPSYWSTDGVITLDEPRSKVPLPKTAESKSLDAKGLEGKDVKVLTHLVIDDEPAKESEDY